MTTSAPLPRDEEARLTTLRRYAILDTDREAVFDRIASLAARQFKVPIALVSLVDEDRQWFKAACGLDVRETPRDPAFCAHAILGDEVFVVADATQDDRFSDNPFVTGEFHLRFYAGAPLKTPSGHKIGTLCLIDREPRHDFTAEDAALLEDLAAVVVDQIEMRSVTGDVLDELETRIAAQSGMAVAEYKLGLFLEHVPLPIAVLDRDVRYIAASDQWRRAFRLTEDDLVGKHHFDLSPHLPQAWRGQYAQCLGGSVLEFEEDKLPCIDGSFHWVRREIRPWHRPDGEIGGLIVINEIIDERKREVEEIEHNQAFLHAVLENIQDGIAACDTEGRLSLSNAATERFHGVDADPIRPEEWSDHYGFFEPDGVTPLPAERVPLFRALRDELVQNQEVVIAPAGQEPRRVISQARPLYDSHGRKLGAMVSSHDITKQRAAEVGRREAETLYSAIFNHTFQFCGLLDPDGTLIEINDTAVKIAGVGRAELVGRPFWECHWWQLGARVQNDLRTAVAKARNGEFVRYKIQIRDARDGLTPIDFSVKPVIDDTGRVAHLIVEGRDISEHMRAEQQLRHSEKHLRLITDNLPLLVGYIDPAFKFRFLNRTGASWYDVGQRMAAGRPAAEVVGSEIFKALKGRLQRALQGEEIRFERRATYPDGVTRDIEGLYVPDRAEDGTVRGVILKIMDVTDRKRAEEEAQKQTRDLALTLNNVPIRIFYKDDQNRILRLNKPAADYLGMTVEEAEGASVYDLLPELAKQYHDHDLEVIRSGKPKLGTIQATISGSGKSGWVRSDRVPYTDPRTGKQFVLVAALDITAEREAEEALRASERRYRALYNKTPVMLHSIDSEGVVTSVSDYWLEKLGYARDEVVGRHSTEFLTAESKKKALSVVLPEFLQLGACNDVELQMVSKSGDTIDVLLSAIAERDPTGNISGSLAVMTDITGRKAVERQLLQAQKMETVGKLTGGLAHDFNNLLGVVLGNLQLIEHSVANDEKMSRRIAAALDAVDKGAELTRRLLAFSRRQTLETVQIELNPRIEGMCEMLTRTLGESVELKCCLEPDIPHIDTDPAQLESAILNLAVNARDAMPDGGTLTIESQSTHVDEETASRETDVDPGDYVTIAVSDTGTGIPADKLERVFEPFFTTKDVGKGSGLGLSMVYGFVTQSGGHVRVYSEEGRGTTVRLYLPRSESADRGSEQAPREPAAAEQRPGHGETVLVVEDHADVREVAVSLLEDLGYRVLQAPDAASALQLIRTTDAIDLLFTDIVMPGGMDGTELAREARALQSDLPVVFATGYAEAAVLNEGDVRSSTNLVTKPYRRDQLAKKVRRALNSGAPSGERESAVA